MNNLVDLTSIIQFGGVVPLENTNSGDVILFKTNNGEEKYGIVIVDENGRKQALASYKIDTVERIISTNEDDDYDYYLDQLNTKGYIEESGAAAAVAVLEPPIEIDNQLVVVCHCNPLSGKHAVLHYYTKNLMRLRELGPTVRYVDPVCADQGDTWENIKGFKKYVWAEHCPVYSLIPGVIDNILMDAYRILEVGGMVIFRVFNKQHELDIDNAVSSGLWTFDIVNKNSEKIPYLIGKINFLDRINTNLAIFTKLEISQSKRPKIDKKIAP